MASINSRNGKLRIDFRYKGQHCREQTRFQDTPANRRKLQTIVERMEAEMVLGTFVYRDYFPKSAKTDFFDELDRKAEAAKRSPYEHSVNIPTFKEFTETWLADMQVEWRESHKRTVISNLNTYHPIASKAFNTP